MAVFKRNSATTPDLGIASPWADSSALLPAIAGDIFGEDWPTALPMSRDEALAIAAVSKARNLLVSVIAKFPLKALPSGSDVPLPVQPTFLYRSDSDVTCQARMAMTVDDLYFSGHSLWAVARGANGQVTDAAWIPRDRWTITNGNILVDGQNVDSQEVLYFQVPGFSGLLNVGNRALRQARDLEIAVARQYATPLPAVFLKQTNEGQLTDKDAAKVVAKYIKARQDPDGVVAFLPYGLDADVTQAVQPTGYLEARNGLVTVVGQLSSIRSSMLDGTSSVDSLTYSTNEGERNAFYDFDLPFWTAPIEARLSQDDVVPRGQRVRFDMYAAFNPQAALPTGEPTED